MITLWMLQLASGVWRGLGFSPSSVCWFRQRSPNATPPRFASASRSTGAYGDTHHRLHNNPSDGCGESYRNDGPSWLTGNDSEGPYRLAFRHVLTANNGDDATADDGSGELKISVLFCNGFRSVMTGGTKAIALEDHCREKGWEFCSFDYRGHGLSSGVFEDCTLTDWIRDASNILDNVLLSEESDRRRKKIVLVGSSMGAWISIHLALRYNMSTPDNNKTDKRYAGTTQQPIAGILGIASGPDFLQDLYSSSALKKQADWRAGGAVLLPSRYGNPYPISWSLIEDAAMNWGILPSTKPILPMETSMEPLSSAFTHLSVDCPVRLLHGKLDEDVPWEKSKELSNLLRGSKKAGLESNDDDNNNNNNNNNNNDIPTNENVVLTLIEDGDHRLSRPQDIKLLLETLDTMMTGL